MLLPAATPAGPSGQVAALRAQGSRLAAREHRALLQLYSLETQLGTARTRLVSIRTQAAKVRAERALVRRQLGITRRAFAVSQRTLAANLRTLYEDGDTDPLAVLLGATTLDDAIASLEEITRTADQNRSVIAQTTATERTLTRLARRLDARSTQLAQLERDAEQTTAALERARGDRADLLARLRTQQRLNRGAVASLVAVAQAAEAKTQTLAAADAAPSSDAAVPPTATEPAPAPPAGGRTLTVSSTGYSLPGRTATGIPVGWGVVAVDPSVIPLGSRMTIPGYGEGVAADTGGAVRGLDIDLWFPTTAQALAWGRRTVTITLH